MFSFLFKRNTQNFYKIFSILLFSFCLNSGYSQIKIREEIDLRKDWITVYNDSNAHAFDGFEKGNIPIESWLKTNIPQNWDQYGGYRRSIHGNLHGYAWYLKKFDVPNKGKNKKYFLYFEGVGSYATVWVNGILVGSHAGGRTTFTLDISNAIKIGAQNLLAVKADHPANIRDLPWVCGGCSEEWGFSEGSQPMGIFRPVTLIITNPVRVEPFGVHLWNDSSVTEQSAKVYFENEIKNYSNKPVTITLINGLYNKFNEKITEKRTTLTLQPNETLLTQPEEIVVNKPVLWSLENPYLYTLRTEILEKNKITDATSTSYGIRWISWPIGKTNTSNQFLLNGKPVLINGTAEYEHNMGESHAFSDEQICTRVAQVRAAGYNAFRDAHQPHNLRYQANWDSLGLLWWPQFAAHIWFNNQAFKDNFKKLLTDWVKERRNSPSIILWGLENESSLPTDFAQECCELIRKLDPTTSSQRKITTCNGGTGTDWNVVQNWSGTYGGNPDNYGNEMKKQLLNGEYGAWRSIGQHTEGPFIQNGILSEDRFTQLMESKIRLAESVKDSICGQFHWILTSHENPGRTQNGEGFRELDRLGPVNYKGLFTPWGEPLDAYYLYRANYADKNKEPMVYIVSHTWPERWITKGKKDSIIVYSNCDEVELFNGVTQKSLGRIKNTGIGTHFQWNNVDISNNILYAIGYINGKYAVNDMIVLNNLPNSPEYTQMLNQQSNLFIQPKAGYNYLYRVNCGGGDYTDSYGNTWLADCHKEPGTSWGSLSWTDDYEEMPAFYGSQRQTSNFIKNTREQELIQTYRYGRDKLKFIFPVPDGEYLIELYFVEPDYTTNVSKICSGWRLFDVAINGNIYLHNLDIQKEVGANSLLKKEITATIKGGVIQISFPEVLSGQAVISAIAIASKNKSIKPAPSSTTNINNLETYAPYAKNWKVRTWLDINHQQYTNKNIRFNKLIPPFFGAEWIQTTDSTNNQTKDSLATFFIKSASDVYITLDARINELPGWLKNYNNANQKINTNSEINNQFNVYTARFKAGSRITLGDNGKINGGVAYMYNVIVVPVSKMEDAADLRPSVRYEAENASLKGDSLKIEEFDKKKYVKFTQNTDTIQWQITPGVAGTYTFKFRYINPTEKKVPMRVKLIDSYGVTMLNEILDFQVNTPDKWRNINISTKGYINAGVYQLYLAPSEIMGLKIDAVDVQ
jgi:beta-galactosidase